MPPVELPSPSPRLQKTLFLLGGYTDKSVLAHNPAGGEGEGLYSVLFDPEADKKLTRLSSSKVKTNPAFIMKHPRHDIVYITTEVIADSGSEVLTGKLDRKTGSVEIIDRKSAYGRSTCHLRWDQDGSHIIAVSYWDSKLTTFPVDSQGRMGEAVGRYTDPGASYVEEARPDRWEHLAHRQRWSHLHQVNLDPYSDQFYMVPDLGRDQIHMFNIKAGDIKHLGVQQLRKGAGPRHMEFHRKLRVVYVCGELDNTVTVFRYNSSAVSTVLKGNYHKNATSPSEPDSLLTEVQSLSTLPASSCRSTIAEMRLHPSGKFLYVGNRGHNSIAVFKVDSTDGSLSLVGVQSSHGAFPRHFNFDNTGRFLLVGNHASDTIVVFAIKDTGELKMEEVVEGVPSIVWVTPVMLD